MAKRFQHEWRFMANPGTIGTGDLVYCDLCGKWQMDGYKDGKPFYMKREKYEELHWTKQIDASEVLGIVDERNHP